MIVLLIHIDNIEDDDENLLTHFLAFKQAEYIRPCTLTSVSLTDTVRSPKVWRCAIATIQLGGPTSSVAAVARPNIHISKLSTLSIIH